MLWNICTAHTIYTYSQRTHYKVLPDKSRIIFPNAARVPRVFHITIRNSLDAFFEHKLRDRCIMSKHVRYTAFVLCISLTVESKRSELYVCVTTYGNWQNL